MSRFKAATAACLVSSATAAGVLLCALAAGKRSRPEAARISEDEAQMTYLAKAREERERRREHRPPAPFPRNVP